MQRISSIQSPGPLWVRHFLCLLSLAVTTPSMGFVNGLEAIAAPMQSIFLRWEDSTNGETGFLIERKLGEAEFEEVITVPADSIHYTDSGLLPGRTYTYRVRAVVPDQELPTREVTVVSLPEWKEVATPELMYSGTDGNEVIFSFAGAGQLYTMQKSADLETWVDVAEAAPIASYEQGEVRLSTSEGSTFRRVLAEGSERPLGIGLTMPFEVPPESGGTVYDVTDFGASPLVENNDDAIGINVAISIAEPGDTIYIPEGNYLIRQTLEIPTGVAIKGEGKDKTRLITEGISTAIRVAPLVHDVTISDLAIDNPGDSEELLYGVYVGSVRDGDNSYRIRIENLRIEHFAKHGVSLRDCHHVLVRNCDILNATNLGGGGHGYGVALNYPTNHNNWITGNTIGPGIRHAILLQYFAHNNLVENNLAVENTEDAFDLHGEDEYANELRFNTALDGDRDGFGVGNTGSTHDRSGPNNWIHHNTVENCLSGIEVIQGSEMVYIDHNTFRDNQYGIRVYNGSGNHIYARQNLISGNERGVSLEFTRWMYLLNNRIENSSVYGIEVLTGVTDFVDQGNTLSGNATDYRPQP